ncbi:MAG TPA: OmpH family outer membrane protein [Prolixibacteraceae bacterium]|nr:OmpH family outer membrane protein [Prolixibacteraceae bacterium]
MKKLPLILSVISLVGVLALTILFMTGKSGFSKNSASHNSASGGDVKIAYIVTDSVLLNYQMAVDLQKQFAGQQQQFNADFASKRQNYESQVTAFQEKVQRGGFLSEDRALKERDRIMGLEEEMKQMDYELSSKLSQMEAQINKQLTDSIMSYVKAYNKTHNYSYILSNTGTIIVGDQKYNITREILDGLNARYRASK